MQRSATLSSVNLTKRDSLKESKTKTFQQYKNSNQITTDSTPDQQGLAKMEMQKWITVQQKTFTKWYVPPPRPVDDREPNRARLC